MTRLRILLYVVMVTSGESMKPLSVTAAAVCSKHSYSYHRVLAYTDFAYQSCLCENNILKIRP